MEYVIKFNESAFNKGEAACERHCKLVSEGLRSPSPFPNNPYPVGSDEAGCWRLGFTFALPI